MFLIYYNYVIGKNRQFYQTNVWYFEDRMNWIDLIILIILVVFVAVGFWKGFIFSILSMFSFFINFAISLFLTRPVTNLLNSWFGLESGLTNAFSNKILSMGEGFSTNLVGMTDSEISSHVSKTLESADFPFKRMFEGMLNIKADQIADKASLTLNDILSKSLGSFFSLIISFIIIFLLIYLVLWIISLISKKAKQVDGIRIVDRILGVLFGLVKGFLSIAFVFAILSFFSEDGLLKEVFSYINQSAIGSFIYQNVNTLVDTYLNFDTLSKAVSTLTLI